MGGSVNDTDAPAKDFPLSSLAGENHVGLRYAFAIVSFIVNSTVILVVTCSRQLHLPRHVYWAGISFIILFCTAQWITELFVNESSGVACSIYELSIGVWYPALLLFLSLAGVDRYVAIRHYEWYKRKVTSKKVILAMVIAWTLNAFVVNIPYWTGYKSLFTCSVNETHMLFIFIWNILLGVVNIALQVKIFKVSRKVIKEYFSDPARRELRVLFNKIGSRVIFIELQPSNQETSPTGSRGIDEFRRECFPWVLRRRSDFRAAVILSANVLPFWLLTFPLAINVIVMYWCSCSSQLDCSSETLLRVDAFLKLLIFVPCIYMPVVYMGNSSEFRRACRRCCVKVALMRDSGSKITTPRRQTY